MPTVSAAELQADREAATERGGYVDRSLAKMKSAESSFELFLSEFPLDAAEPYPPVDKLVDYASWCSRTRQVACLAQRGVAVRKGIGKRSARQYIGDCWCTKCAAFGELPCCERCGYWQAVFDRFDGMMLKHPVPPW